MAVKIRLTRTGKKKQPTYRVVVMDSRKPRDGRYIEQIGRYDARQDPSLIEIDNDRALDWLRKGAQPTERAQKLLEISGAWAQFRVDKGEIHTVGEHQPKHWPEKVHVVEPSAEPGVPDENDDAETPVEAADDTEALATSEGLPEEAENLEETE
jgi:small subunit ribosomal protein S16